MRSYHRHKSAICKLDISKKLNEIRILLTNFAEPLVNIGTYFSTLNLFLSESRHVQGFSEVSRTVLGTEGADAPTDGYDAARQTI